MCAIGTGTMFLGISNASNITQNVIGIPVLKEMSNFLEQNKMNFKDIKKIDYCKIFPDYHFGGYAKTSPELDKFCRDFYFLNRIQIEPVYTGKMFWALQDLIKKGTFPVQSSITAIHTGGIYPFFP